MRILMMLRQRIFQILRDYPHQTLPNCEKTNYNLKKKLKIYAIVLAKASELEASPGDSAATLR